MNGLRLPSMGAKGAKTRHNPAIGIGSIPDQKMNHRDTESTEKKKQVD
jgi:hypothetical protein